MDSNLPRPRSLQELGQNRSASMTAGFSSCSGEDRKFEIVFNATAPHRPKHCDLEKFTRPRRLCSMLWHPLFSSTILLTSSSTLSCLSGLSWSKGKDLQQITLQTLVLGMLKANHAQTSHARADWHLLIGPAQVGCTSHGGTGGTSLENPRAALLFEPRLWTARPPRPRRSLRCTMSS